LFLNVFKPRVTTAKKATIVFIHGGDFVQGYSGGLLYDCTSLVESHDVVCVTLNYRLGALGFLYTPDSSDHIEGNYAVQDQQLALKWVQSNIAAFGGDPDNVTLFGQSAGAASVAVQNVSPFAKGLFHRSMMLSNPFSLPMRDSWTWGSLVKEFTKQAGCKGTGGNSTTTEVDCLQNLSADAVVDAQIAARHDVLDEWTKAIDLFMPWTPTVNTDILPKQPLEAFHAGELPNPSRPIILNTVRNEAVLFIWEASAKPMSAIEYDLFIEVLFAGSGGKVLKEFPIPSNASSDARLAISHVGTLALMVCPGRYAMQGMAAPAYVSHFDHVMSFGKQVWGANFTECDNVVCHGGDLPFWFHPNGTSLGIQYTPAEQNLSMAMQTYFTSFAKGGVPLPPSTTIDREVNWPTFNMTTQAYMKFNTPENSLEFQSYAQECGFFDEIGYNFY
jgi:carboxylesterase type B